MRQLLRGINTLKVSGDKDITITGIKYDSRQVTPGDVFVCIKGFRSDGHQYAKDAIASGASVIVVEKDIPIQEGITKILVDDTRKTLGVLARNFYGDPSSRLFLAGITGTNGKTTTAFLARAVLSKVCNNVALMGTIANMVGTQCFSSERTTSESLDTIAFLDRALSQSAEAAVMEVSSHAISLNRLSGLEFDCGVFTNLTRDHLDFHNTLDEYLEAKGQYFSMLGRTASKEAIAFVNADDPSSYRISAFVKDARLLKYGIQKDAEIRAVDVDISAKGVTFAIKYTGKLYPVSLKLHGTFNVYNALGAFGIGVAKGIDPELIVEGLEGVNAVPGRFESIDCGQDFTVIVDYAHTPDGLLKVLDTARTFAMGRLIVVFGCGGDRDRTKRPIMGEIAFRNSDFAIVTSDNPRTEDRDSIIRDIEGGFTRSGAKRGYDYFIAPDRYDAIARALDLALPGDVVLVCGKGHETYQIIGDNRLEFDDRQVLRKIMEEMRLCKI